MKLTVRMNTPPAPLISPHRTARLIRWAVTMLSWIMLALISDAGSKRRHIRDRYGFISLTWLRKLLCSLALVRAVEIATARRPPQPTLRNTASAGFYRRTRRPAMMRAIYGSRLRKALRATTPRGRIERLLAAFADLDGFARAYLVTRARRRLTKLCAIILRAPPAEAVAFTAASAPISADTS